MTSIVALDIETTGLDPNRDAVIEIGAVRFNDRRVEDEWTTLLNPGRPIPEFITRLTGINDNMVRSAPTIESILAKLEDFVGDNPVLGHNVRFDLSFFQKFNLFRYNDHLDTYDLAAVLLPSAGRYNLSALGQTLGIPLPATHRALDDTRVTYHAYLQLFDLALALPFPLIEEIVRLGEGIDWGAGWAFKQALQQKMRKVAHRQGASQRLNVLDSPMFTISPPLQREPLGHAEQPVPLDVEEVAALLEHGGEFARHFPHYEYRPQQLEMLRQVAAALSRQRHLLVEAGTGTGKSVAYLVPAALFALQNQTRVVISTNTINLQDQLMKKDIPDLQAVLDKDLRATVLKGRRNYLCPRRLEALRRKGPESEEEMRVLAKMLIWLSEAESGDLSDINITGPGERAVWGRISAEDEGCTTDTCVRRMHGVCPFHRARQAAQTSHLLVVNHALLLADVATGSRVLPEYDYLIADEAHHLEAAITSALSFTVSQALIERTLRELGGPNAGILGRILVVAHDLLDPGQRGALRKQIESLTDKAFHFQNQSNQFFIAIDQFLLEQREGKLLGNYAHQERILPATRTQPAWMEVEVAWEEAALLLKPTLLALESVGRALVELANSGEDEIEDLQHNLGDVHLRLSEMDKYVNALVFEPSPDQIYWVEIHPNQRRVVLQAAPLHIGALMEQHIWMEKSTVILTSATLTAANEFGYLRGRLNAFDADELAVGSPFDYETSTLLYLAQDIPEPSDRRGHQRAVEQGLINLCKATNGRTLALFTSYSQLQETSGRIGPVLAEHGIQVYEQGEGASPHTLLETFKSSEAAVLLGTRAFWEGVDVPGEALSVLAIVKLPFDVPSDPVVAARSETFEQPFYEYSVPEAILRFRQGFGRLIRTQQDRGVVAILDKRVISKKYGKLFLDSLPQCTVKTGPLGELPKAAVKWLGL